MPAAENTLGVPPPIKMLLMVRPCTRGRSCCKSASKCAIYSCSGIPCLTACELKSQYGHFWIHHGIWIYSARGGNCNDNALILCVLSEVLTAQTKLYRDDLAVVSAHGEALHCCSLLMAQKIPDHSQSRVRRCDLG